MSKNYLTIQDYLNHLAELLNGSDPALIMDAVNDASEFLFFESQALTESNPGMSKQQAILAAMEKFGDPEEVAEAFLQTEDQVSKAFSMGRSIIGEGIFNRVFGVFLDPRSYTAMLYMLLGLVTSMFYLIWVLYGAIFSIVLSLFTIGLPLALLFLGSVRALALMECRLIETLLGERMPRRTFFTMVEGSKFNRLLATVKDGYTWRTLGLLVIKIPLGFLYFIIFVMGFGVALELLLGPFFTGVSDLLLLLGMSKAPLWWALFMTPLGLGMVALCLHLARWLGPYHARLAKWVLFGKQPD